MDIKIRDRQHEVRPLKELTTIIIEERFSNGEHLTRIYRQLAKAKGIRYKFSTFIPISTLKTLYNVLFLSRLVYGISVWSGTSATYINKTNNIVQSIFNLF